MKKKSFWKRWIENMEAEGMKQVEEMLKDYGYKK